MSKKLLLADDSVTIQKVVGLIFANGEYDLQCVSNGDAAFEKISFEQPDILLADVNMPGKNGFELCSAIKNNPESSKVPVLLLVGSFEPFDEDEARAAGADGWIIKPFESQDLIDEVEGLLSRPADAVSCPETGGAVDAAEPDTWADMELDNLGMEAADDSAVLEETFHGEGESGGVQLEEDILWEEDSPAVEEPQPESASGTGEEVLAEEDDILFIDEDDLLDDEPQPITVSTSVEKEIAAAEIDTPPVAEFDAPAVEIDTPPVAEADPFTIETDTPTKEVESFAIETDTPTAEADPFAIVTDAPTAELEPFAIETEAPTAEAESFAIEMDTPTTEEDPFAIETELPAEDSLPAESPVEMPPEPAAGSAVTEVQPAAETSSQSVPEKADLDYWRNDSLINSLASVPAPESQKVLERSPSAAEPVEAAASNVAEAVAPDVQETAGLQEDEVVARVQALSEDELGRIVERVAGAVIERLAGSILEKIAWEVVPDLAEGMIKEEIRKITETSH